MKQTILLMQNFIGFEDSTKDGYYFLIWKIAKLRKSVGNSFSEYGALLKDSADITRSAVSEIVGHDDGLFLRSEKPHFAIASEGLLIIDVDVVLLHGL